MTEKKDFSVLNSTMCGMIAFVISVPLHEFIHLVTGLIYGQKLIWFSSVAVNLEQGFDFMSLSPFHRAMAAGGSASIVNILIAAIVFLIIMKVDMNPLIRVFMIQFYGMNMCLGFGYFMINGIFGAFGDWGNVFELFPASTVVVMRIVLGILGSAGIVFTMFSLNFMSYFFIEDVHNKKERFHVALGLHLLPFAASSVLGILIDLNSILRKEGYGDLFFWITVRFMFIPLFWGFMFTWFMVKPLKEGHFIYKITREPKYILWTAAVIMMALDLFVLARGIKF